MYNDDYFNFNLKTDELKDYDLAITVDFAIFN